MPYYVKTEASALAGRSDVEPSASVSFAGAVGSAVTGNVSSVIADYGELQQANQGPRLSKADSEKFATEAGVKLKIPEDGYTRSALDILVKRKRDESLRQRVDEATPWSWVGSPVRGGAMLLAGVSDPLNVASAFIPVVGQARAASMLARAGESGFARAATRTAIGAAEGAFGAAVVEVPTYLARTSLQDDYTLTDSLVNMAFGTAMGGGLHAAGGAVGDAFRGGVNPYARFAGLDVPAVRGVLDFEAGRRTADGFSSGQRRAAGLIDQAADVAQVPVAAVEQSVLRAPSAELAKVADAPFAKLYETTRESAKARAVAEVRDELQGATALEQRPAQGLEADAAAARAAQDIAKLERGEVPEQYRQRVQERVDQMMGASEISRAVTGTREPPAAFLVGMAQPETREATMRTALAHMAAGRLPDVDAVLRSDPGIIGARSTPGDVRRVADHQSRPDAAAFGDPKAADAATQRQQEAAKQSGEQGAKDELQEAMQQLQAMLRNLEAAGVAPDKAARMGDLSSFQEGVKQADAIGRALEAAALCGVRQ